MKNDKSLEAGKCAAGCLILDPRHSILVSGFWIHLTTDDSQLTTNQVVNDQNHQNEPNGLNIVTFWTSIFLTIRRFN